MKKMKAAKLIQLLIIFPFRRYKRMELTEEYRRARSVQSKPDLFVAVLNSAGCVKCKS